MGIPIITTIAAVDTMIIAINIFSFLVLFPYLMINNKIIIIIG